jgi:hypothetical protein
MGWIWAVQIEYMVACELLDEEHSPLPTTTLTHLVALAITT